MKVLICSNEKCRRPVFYGAETYRPEKCRSCGAEVVDAVVLRLSDVQRSVSDTGLLSRTFNEEQLAHANLKTRIRDLFLHLGSSSPDERLAAIERRKPDPLIEEKLARIDARIDSL